MWLPTTCGDARRRLGRVSKRAACRPELRCRASMSAYRNGTRWRAVRGGAHHPRLIPRLLVAMCVQLIVQGRHLRAGDRMVEDARYRTAPRPRFAVVLLGRRFVREVFVVVTVTGIAMGRQLVAVMDRPATHSVGDRDDGRSACSEEHNEVTHRYIRSPRSEGLPNAATGATR